MSSEKKVKRDLVLVYVGLESVMTEDMVVLSLKIEFGTWFKWKERNSINGSDKPGVYMMARFKKGCSQSADPLDEDIIYFGETCNQSLKERWNQFDASAFQLKHGHSGGTTYNKVFGDKGVNLYVAAMPVAVENKDFRSSFIRFAERKLILDFVLKCNRLPICNRK